MRLTILISLLVMATGATVAEAAKRQRLHAGTTSQDEGVYLRTTANGKRLAAFSIIWRDRCNRRLRRYTTLELRDRVRIRNRRFSARRTYREARTGRRVTIRVSGRIGRVARGHFRARSRTGSRKCTTRKIRWRARRVR